MCAAVLDTSAEHVNGPSDLTRQILVCVYSRCASSKQLASASEDAACLLCTELLDVRPFDRALMLAGAQASDAVHLLAAFSDGLDEGVVPSGLLVLNEPDTQALRKLTCKLETLPRSPLVFTRCDPQKMPMLFTSSTGHGFAPWTQGQFVLGFDRILCDVPCAHHSKHDALRLHLSQVRTLQRGLQLLSPGGCLVYATRSEHAVENEAVVATALSTLGTDCRVDLVDGIGDRISFPHCDGLECWSVPGPSRQPYAGGRRPGGGLVFKDFEDVPPKLRGRQIRATMFPPRTDKSQGLWVRSQLRRCVRVLSGDSGPPCFIAVFASRKQVVSREVGTCMQDIRSGSRVVVRSTGAPAVVIGPGSKAYEGLVKVRYPDRSTYHLPANDLKLAEPGTLKIVATTGNLSIYAAVFLNVIGLLVVRFCPRWMTRSLVMLVVSTLFASRLNKRSAANKPAHAIPGTRVPGSRLVKGFGTTPELVVRFCEWFGLFTDKAAASDAGVVAFPCSSLCYRSSDKKTLYLASRGLFELRVPPQQRDAECGRGAAECGTPLFTRVILPEEKRLWGDNCPLRPCNEAASLLACCASCRLLRLRPTTLARLLRESGGLSVAELCELEISGEIDGLATCMTPGEFGTPCHGAVVIVLWNLEAQVRSMALIGVLSSTSLKAVASEELLQRFRVQLAERGRAD